MCIFHQVLYIEQLFHALICPNQLHINGVDVNDFPLQYLPHNWRSITSHAIVMKELLIPLKSHGVINYFECWKKQ
jgi:hypothetical protein